MECFMRDERDTLISQPFPPHVRHAAGARLSQYVQTLLEDKCPDRSGYAWPLRSLLNRTVRTTASMDLQHISTRAVYTRFLYDIAIDAVSYQVDEDKQINVASVGLLRWAECVENRHLFRVVRLDANSEFHCDRWGLELTGKSPAKGTSAPAGRAQGERSNAKRRKDFPNPSVCPSPHFSSASSSSSDPRGPIAGVNGQSRGGESSSNFVQPPPISVMTPCWLFPGTHPNHILSRRVPTLLKSQKKWRSVSELLDHFLDYTQPEECNGLVTYLRSIAQVGYIPSHNLDALAHATCHGFIAWANLAINKPHFVTLGIPAKQDPVSLLIDQHRGDNYFLSWRWDTPLPPPVVQPNGRAIVRRLPRLINLSTDRSLLSADFNPSLGAGGVRRGIILSLLHQPQAPNGQWWSIDDLLEKGVHLPDPDHGVYRSSEVKTSEYLTNYIEALGTIGLTPPTDKGAILAAGLYTWARLPEYKHLVVVFEFDAIYGITAFGYRPRLQNPALGIGERYHFKLPDGALPEPDSPSIPDSQPPPSPPRDNRGPPIILRNNPDGTPAHSNPFTPHPDPDPMVNPLLGKAVTYLLCCQGPTAQDSYTVTELIGHLTELSEGMTANKKYKVCLFRRYLQLCAAEYSVTTGDDHCILCIGLLRWAKFPRNNLTYMCFESYPSVSHPGNRWRLRINHVSTPATTPAPYSTPPMDLFADAILSRIVTDLLSQPSSMHDEWWTVDELLFHAGEEWTDMGPTPVGNDTFFAAYLHSWADQGGPTPLASCWGVCAVGLIHWACQPNKESIYLVSKGPLQLDLAEDGGTGDPEKLWCIKLIRADTDSITAPSPPAPPPPDDDPPEDEKRKDKTGGNPGPSELFRAMERLSSGLKGSTSQGGTTAPAPQSSSTLPQHNLGFNPDSAHANECGKKINIPPGFINLAAHVGEDVDFWEDYSSDDNSDDCVPPPPPPDSPPPPSPPGSPPDMQTCIPCGDPVVNLPTRPTPRRVAPLAQTESEIESIRRLKLTKEARDKEDKYEALHGENDRRIRKLIAITMAEDAELERQIEETIMQLHIDQLPRRTVPRNHSMSTRNHSPPEVAQCALKDCNKDAFVIGGTASLCCSRSHLKYLQALRSKTRCALPECERPVHFRPDLLLAYDFCCINHAKLANKYGNKPKAGPGGIKCGFPSCDNLVFYYSTTGHYDFCGMTCRDRTANLPVTPPMLELTCTQFTTLAAGAVPPPF